MEMGTMKMENDFPFGIIPKDNRTLITCFYKYVGVWDYLIVSFRCSL